MTCSAFSLTLGILSSLVVQDVSTVRLPLAGNNDIDTITSRISLEVHIRSSASPENTGCSHQCVSYHLLLVQPLNNPEINISLKQENEKEKHNDELPRSLEMEDFALRVAPTSGRVNSPTILRLYPLSAKSAHPHANLPLRFGRELVLMKQTAKSAINLPQRFGRSQQGGSTSGLECSMCRRGESPPSATLPQRFGRRNLMFGEPILASSSIRDRTQDYDYIIETVQDKA